MKKHHQKITLDVLRAQLDALDAPDDAEIIIRAEWEGAEPEGNCFLPHGVSLETSHDDEGTLFIALECDQEDI